MSFYNRVTRAAMEWLDPYDLDGPPPTQQVWPYLKSMFRPLRKLVAASLFFTVLAAVAEVWLIGYAGRLIDLMSSTTPKDIWREHGLNLATAAGAVLILRPLAQFARLVMNDITLNCNVATLVRWRAYDHLVQQSVGWFQEDLSGRTSSRLVDVGNYAADLWFNSLNAIAFGLVYMIGIATLMASADVRLAIPLLLWLGLYIALLISVVPRMIEAQRKFHGAKSALTGSVVDCFSNFDTLQLFAKRDALLNEQRGKLEDTRRALLVTRQIGIRLRTSLLLLEGMIMVGFIGYGIWLWTTEAATIGLVSAAVALSIRTTTMADWILEAVLSIFLRIGSLRDALSSIGQPIAIPQDDNVPDLAISDGAISLENVHHHYGTDKGGLNGVTLDIKAGEKIGIVGRSGAGKSTLVNLILRFFEVESGAIKIDGQDIRHVEQDSLRAAIGMVTQQAALLNRSVKDNISLGRENLSEEDIFRAAKEAHAHDFICDLQDAKGRAGYDAHVGERGVKLSGGQRQRVALARVILKDAPILILDEATSALDSEVEAKIQSALTDVMRDKTVIAIAHRLSTIAQMDRIVVMDKGRVAEQGSHAELLSKGGLYAQFWNRQSGGMIDTEED